MISETLWIINTRSCNLNCAYCYQGSHKWTWQKERGLFKMMTEETLDKALPFLLDWAKQGLHVCWYGGEPTLNLKLMETTMPHWTEFFKSINKEISWSVTTNGTLLDQKCRDILDKNACSILLSMDGPPESHNLSRVYYGGKPSWQDIPVDDILKWRPNIEIAWQIDPRWVPEPKQLDWMIARGFKRINFNLNWLNEWPAEARIKLEEFMQHVVRKCLQSRKGIGDFNSNFMGKLDEALMKQFKPAVPCGTGLHMMALTPEGWLYPSQEMAFSALEPNRAPGTAEYYRIGNVHNDPVIDQERLGEVSTIRNDQMIIPEGFDCNNCIANPISFGGCHCRYVGQDGTDPANRYGVAIGWCQSIQSALTGLLQGAMIERYVGMKLSKRPEQPEVGRQEFKMMTRQKFNELTVPRKRVAKG